MTTFTKEKALKSGKLNGEFSMHTCECAGGRQKNAMFSSLSYIPSLRKALEETSVQKDRLVESSKDAIKEIEERAKYLISCINDVKNRYIEKVTLARDEELKSLSDHEEEISSFLEYLGLHSKEDKTERCRKCRSLSMNGINLCRTCQRDLQKIKYLSDVDHVCILFKPSGCSEHDIDQMFGCVDNYHIMKSSISTVDFPNSIPTLSAELVAEFSCTTNTNVHAILPVSESDAWICTGWGSNKIDLLSKTGLLRVSLALENQVDHMCMLSSGDILVSCYNAPRILKIDDNLHVSEFSSLDFFPSGMFVHMNEDEEEHVFVCGTFKLCSSMSNANIKGKRKHVIAKLTTSGEVASELDVSPHDPHRVAVDMEGHMFFSDYGADKKRKFIIMDISGTIIRAYQGMFEAKSENTFYPLGVCRDRFGNLLVSDWNNDCIHLLNKDGLFLKFLLTSENGISSPSALAIDHNDQLWVGNGMGQIKVFSYL